MIFSGRNLVKYPYSCYGYTRGGSKPWHRRIMMRWMPRTAKKRPQMIQRKSAKWCYS
nr:MAG TPA: hypothetical protein [Caudoviricetes sp.]